MTEVEWLTASDPVPMLTFLRDLASDRKLRLFACAMGWRFALLTGVEDFARGLDTAEIVADGGEPSAMRACRRAINPFMRDWIMKDVPREVIAALYLGHGAMSAKGFRDIGGILSWLRGSGWASETIQSEVADSHRVIREVFCNPFRPVSLDPRWRTSAVLDLARSMYESRDFAAMPILADALEEAGCDDADVLAHCRGDGPHVRGCWVVDLVLRKD
jgi:hypothetical protein